MTCAIVPIREGSLVPRKNRGEDSDAIRFRKMISLADTEAFSNENVEVLALSWEMERRLPRSRLRCLNGTLNAKRDLALRLAELEIARHESEAYRARVDRQRILNGKAAAEAMYAEHDRLFERFRQATMDMALTPAWTKHDLRRKRSAIGRVWLTAEGPWYDALRAGVAAVDATPSRSREGF